MTIPSDSHKYTPVAVPVTGDDGATSPSPLGERFIATPADTPTSEAQPFLEVVAPATLPEGYRFEAEANGHRFTVEVPVGGVAEGQKFSVPFPAGANGFSGSAIPRASVPVGHWKDGLCDCFRHGPIHPAIWNAWCCPLILVGQVLRRHKLTWLGNEGSIAQTTGTFRILVLITVVFIIIDQFLSFITPFSVDEASYLALTGVRALMEITLGIFTVFLVAKTRNRIRSKYGIPEKQCAGCEDCCCSFWCNCCTVSQMARHTADYDTYAGLCCSETGTPPNAPSIV